METTIERGEKVQMPTKYGDFQLIPYRQTDNGLVHVALIKGEWKPNEPVLVRVHSSCATGDILALCVVSVSEQLHLSMQRIEKEEKALWYI